MPRPWLRGLVVGVVDILAAGLSFVLAVATARGCAALERGWFVARAKRARDRA